MNPADALAFAVPGFVALQFFYKFGLRGRRTDLELTLWSLLVSAFISPFPAALGIKGTIEPLAAATATGAVWGYLAARLWKALVARNKKLRVSATRRAWDAILTQPAYVQVWTKTGYVIRGHPEIVALDSEADRLDIYISEPSWVDPTGIAETRMTGAAGVIIDEDAIDFIQVLGGEVEEGDEVSES